MAYVSTIVSGAACVGVLLGLISGIFLVVLTAMKWVSKVRASLHEEELSRQKRFLANGRHPGEGLQGRKEKEKEKENGIGEGRVEDEVREEEEGRKSEEQGEGPSGETVEVREKMEKMVETMIGGPLDGTTVGQLSSHSAYMDMFRKYHSLLCRELAKLGFALHLTLARKNESSVEVKDFDLKRLIKQIVDEAMALPDIKQEERPPEASKDATPDEFHGKSYEDILATAILNKVIQSFQNNGHKQSQSHVGDPKSRLRHRNPKNDGNDELRSDGDWSDTSRSDQLSLCIEEYIEEVTTALEGSEDDGSDISDFETAAVRRIPFPESGRTVVDGTDDDNSEAEEQSAVTELLTSTSSWEENWLFQKKRLRSTPNAHHPVPVPMLVPNPSEDFRALVGGVDADDLSDMSDCSDSALQDLITTEEKPPKAVEGSPSTPPDAQEEKTETVKVILTHITEESFFEKMNDGGVMDAAQEDTGSVEVEGTERVEESSSDAVAEESSQEPPGTESRIPPTGYVSIPDTAPGTDNEDGIIRSRVAEREKEKWMNAVPLPDNPYSFENIAKREQQRRRNNYFRIGPYGQGSIHFPDDPTSDDEPSTLQRTTFARDYYVNASKHPKGMPEPDSRQVSTPPQSSPSLPTSPAFYPDIADGSAQYFLPSHPLPRHHFSRPFFSSLPPTTPPRRYRYGSHTLKLRSNHTLNRPLHQHLSAFEQKALREDLPHSLLRPRGATPNFVLNPVFDPETATAAEDLRFSALSYHLDHPRFPPPTGQPLRMSQESGYGSDSLDHSSDSLESWRLTPPKTPEVVEASFVSLVGSRRRRERGVGVRRSLSTFC